jgi:pSer/pThr/pTyr-binding forkhead associated (FHA) protein
VSELTLMLIRFAYLAILWIFVLSAISVVRSDMFGARIDSTPRAERRAERQQRKQAEKSRPKPAKRPRGAPTHIAVVDGANAGEKVSLDEAPVLIGRGSDAGIRLDDDYVSTRHARIASSGDQWFVEDLGSTNGTYVGNSRISQATAIQLGTQIRIGKTILELRK